VGDVVNEFYEDEQVIAEKLVYRPDDVPPGSKERYDDTKSHDDYSFEDEYAEPPEEPHDETTVMVMQELAACKQKLVDSSYWCHARIDDANNRHYAEM